MIVRTICDAGMNLYRYLPYKYWKDVVRKGFAAQRASAYEDILEGARHDFAVGNIL